MKRKVLSLITALALCLSLCPVWVLAGDTGDSAGVEKNRILDKDTEYLAPYEVTISMTIDTNGYTLSAPNTSAIQVTGTGRLYLTGTVVSKRGAGVEVLSGGYLSVTDPGTTINGTNYALDVASGAEVSLAAGTYTGKGVAIRTEDGDFAALLAPGCSYFDAAGEPILPADVGDVRTVTVGRCTNHLREDHTPVPGTTTHTWTCPYCEASGTEKCTFTAYDQNGTSTCGLCGNEITVEVDRESLKKLAYDDTVKPANGTVTVTPDGGTPLSQADYTVSYATRAAVGNTDVTVTVKVEGVAYNGTFTQDYTFTQSDLEKPVLQWDTTNVAPVPYTGEPVTKDKLPSVTINITTSSGVDLHDQLKYSYRTQGGTAYTDGLPTNAGTYDVVVSLPEGADYQAASCEPITLVIEKIDPIATAPAAARPTFNGAKQELVTAGTLVPAAVADGLTIEFATEENGTYSAAIPGGTNADTDYRVWYKVVIPELYAGNYNAAGPTEITGVEILRKRITPDVTLSDDTYLYDGGFKEPKVTVKDEDHVTVLPDTEYSVAYSDNRNVGTAKVTVTDKPGGNYELTQVEKEFQITSKEQATLTITKKPDTVTYGAKFTLETSGGAGNGIVTWEITDGEDVAEIDEDSGQVTVIGHGSATVKATKSGKDPTTGIVNYDDADAYWTFTADKKPVVATVTAEDKTYDTNTTATVHAVVEQGVLPGDEIKIDGLTGEFDDENAGVNKTVTVDTGNSVISGTNYEHYDISFSGTTVQATIRKAIADITTVSAAAGLTYDGTAQELITGAAVDPSGIQVEYALSQAGPYSTAFPEATNAGTYTVWYRVVETDNYTGLAPDSVDVTIAKKLVIPAITLDQSSFVYDGTAKEPGVKLTEADGTTIIPSNEYTVTYSDNTNVSTAAAPATVTVTAKADGNYSFMSVTETFTISREKARVITAPEAAGDPLYYKTWVQKLVTPGTGTGGTMVYAVGDENGPKETYSEDIPSRQYAETYRVYYKVAGDGNHSDSDVGYVDVTIAPKTVEQLVIELRNDDGTPFVDCAYDGNAKEPKVVVKDGSVTIDAGEYTVVYSDNINAGRATVHINDNPGGNYNVTGSTQFVIQKADIVFNPEPTDAGITYDGKAHELLLPGETSGGTVLYALGSATSAYSDAIPTATEAGTYTVYYKVVGDENHNSFAIKPVIATIKPKEPDTITIILTPDTFEYDGTVKLPQITVMDGKTVLPKEEYDWACTLNGTAADEPKDEGTYTITITDAADGNYDLTGVTANTADFTIAKISQEELVIGGKPPVIHYGDRFQLTVSGGSANGAVTWNVTNGPATIDNSGNVIITGVGEVTITVEKAADTNYLSAQAKLTFTAAPKPVMASVTVADKVYDGTNSVANTAITANVATVDLVNGSDSITISGLAGTYDNAGAGAGKTVTLDTSHAQVTGTDAAKYEVSYPDTVTAAIKQATTTITDDPEQITPLTYSGQPQELVTAGRTNVGFIVYSLDGTDFSPEIPTGTDAGTYTVYYKVDGTTDYTGVTGNPISVTIDPKSISPKIELSQTSYPYDGSKKEPIITVKDGNTVIDSDQYVIDWGSCDQTSVGTHTLEIQDKAGANYTFQAPKTASITITPATQASLTITGKPDHVYYGDTFALDTTGGSGDGTVTWSVTAGGATIKPTGELTVTDTGSVTVEAKRTVPNYGTVSDTLTFTVEPKPVVAEVTVADKVYDGTTVATVTKVGVKASDLVDGSDVVTFDVSEFAAAFDDVNAGTNKTVTVNSSAASAGGAAAGKYTVSYPASVTAGITPRQVAVTVELSGSDLQTDTDNSVTPPAYSYTYDGTDKTPAVKVTGTDTSGYSAVLTAGDYDVTYSNNKNVGNAAVTVKSKAGGNYTFDDETVNFAIKEAEARLTSSPLPNDLTYTGQPLALVTAGTATGGHIEYSTDGTNYSAAIPEKTSAGSYTVYYKVVGDGNHASGTEPVQIPVTIKRKEIDNPKITVSGSYTYNGSPQKPSGTDVVVKDGTETISDTEYTLAYQNNVNAGTATVIVVNASGGNYIVNGTAAFTIDKADAAVTTPPVGLANLPYNGTAQELITAGTAANGIMVYSLSENGPYSPAVPKAKDRDTYTVYYKAQGDSNYKDTAPTPVTASIVTNTVSNPIIQVTPESATFNGQKQEPVVTVWDDNNLLIDGSEYTVTPSGNMTDQGMYTLTIAGTGANYSFRADATFKILPADQTSLVITNPREHVYYGDKFPLSATGGNGTVTWEVEAGAPATIERDSGLLTITGVGSVKVKATSRAPGYTDQTASLLIQAEKKPVTAVVTAAAKTYDGNKTATVTATLQSSDLVSSDKVVITLSGSFEDPNAGTDKKVNIDSTNPQYSADSTGQGNYNIAYPATTTASILKADIDPAKVTAPEAANGLEYTGLAQALVTTAGSVTDGTGTMEYSLDGRTYSASLPTGTGAGDYDVWYRVKGDGNHNDVDGTKLAAQAAIARQAVTSPIIEFTPNEVSYDGAVHKPTVTVKDKYGRVIPDSEYDVDYGSSDWKTASSSNVKHIVTITDKTDGNYVITGKSAEYTIRMMGQNSLSILQQPGAVRYGDTFTLVATGGSGTGAVTWSSDKPDVATIDQDGLVKVLKSGGPVTITATKEADDNYGATTVKWSFSAEKRPVTAIVTAKDREYAPNNKAADLVITWQGLLGSDTVSLTVTGAFDDDKVGDNKTVRITKTVPDDDRYAITCNDTTTASITPKTATVTAPTPIPGGLTYNGGEQALVNGGSAVGGTIYYSSDGVIYGPNIPTGKNAGTYTVWYKAVAGENYKDSPAAVMPVTIAPKPVADPEIELSNTIFNYDGTPKKPDVVVKDGSTEIPAGEYTVTYSNNIAAGTDTAQVKVANADGGNYVIREKTVTFTIKSGAATLTLPPEERTLTYNGGEQSLVRAGTAVNGQVVYALTDDADDYGPSIPKKTDAGTYEVWYKVKGDQGYEDTIADYVTVTIQPKPVTPAITLSGSDPFTYTGAPVKPDVTVAVEGKTLVQGTDYTVTYSGNTEPGTATVTVQSVSGINYQFYATETFTIAKAKATFYTDPEGRNGLVYNGTAQELIEEYTGISLEGIVLYSLNAQTYSAEIPTATKARTYTVFAKIQGDSTHADSDVIKIPVEIAANDGSNLTVGLSDAQLNYTGSALQPTVTVTDDSGNVIPVGDYTVSYSDNINVGKATVTVTGKAPNCTFTKTASFEIVGADQPTLSITGQPDKVFYGDTFQLGTTGGSASGTVTWTSSDPDVATVANGVVTVKKAGNTVITAGMASGGNYTGPAEAFWTLIAQPKPLGITVFAADKPYNAADNTAVLTVVVNSSDWVSGSDIDTITATGHFLNMSVGDNQTVIIDTLTLPSGLSDKYIVANPGTTTASITPVSASVTGAPAAKALTYNGSEQALIDAGGCTAEGGDLAYSLDGVSYSFNIPTGKNAGTYTVWYKAVAANENYKDSTPVKMEAEIAANTGKPTVKCSPASLPYDNTEKTPAVIVLDADGREIPKEEYTVEYPDSRVAVGRYTVTVKDIPGGNYEFTDEVTGTFDIMAADQSPLSIISGTPTNVHYGDTFRLSASGGSGSGAIRWKSTNESVAAIDGSGVVEVVGTGNFMVEAYREAAGGYSQSNTATLPFHADPKPVTPVVTADDKSFDGKTDATLHASWKAGDLVGTDKIEFTGVSGQFVNPDVGTGKQVKVTSGTPSGGTGNYIITWPDSTTASIYRVNAELETRPGKPDLTYTGAAQRLLTGGKMKGDGKIGTIVYSLSEKGEYSETIPTGTNAGTYVVWYKVEDSVNYMGIPAASIEVTIQKATPTIGSAPTASGTEGQKLSNIALTGGSANVGGVDVPGSFAWANGDTEAAAETAYDVIFTPDDTANCNTATIQVTAVSSTRSTSSTASTASAAMRTTVRNGTASTVLSAAEGSRLVQQAAASRSRNVVIKPEITGSVTKTEVAIPASTVSQLQSRTGADLTVSTPIADVTIPNAALDTLSGAGGTVNVMTEQTERSVVLTLTADGGNVENVPVTLSVPAEDAGPGTVAVLVHEDGTRETIRKSVVEDGRVNIPLNGSATVEIVDNSKEFTDVPSASWASDAVAFASAHELFSGTSETTFSPNQPMSRGMLATVLYNLEGHPDQEGAATFSDVGGDAWYADGVTWATENGIANGYSSERFGPDDNVTREQFAVMLWKYAGSPEADGQELNFTDAGQASGYALEALRWATANGILSGYGGGQLDPNGITTRAQAAQMLKNFLENT